MFEILLYIFAVWGVIQTVLALLRFMLGCSVQAAILYPMDLEQGDAYYSLRVLSRLNLPLIVVKADGDDTEILEKEFMYANFVERSELTNYLKERY